VTFLTAADVEIVRYPTATVHWFHSRLRFSHSDWHHDIITQEATDGTFYATFLRFV